MKSAETAPDGKYFTQKNQVPFLAFCNALCGT